MGPYIFLKASNRVVSNNGLLLPFWWQYRICLISAVQKSRAGSWCREYPEEKNMKGARAGRKAR